jgi:hypothetical protein
MKAEGTASKAPFAEAFGHLEEPEDRADRPVAIMFAQGAVWYTAFFYAQTFMDKFLKVRRDHQLLMMAATAVSAPLYVVFGWLSDKIGRKPVMLFGMTLMLIAYFPGFHMLTQPPTRPWPRPRRAPPVVVVADPADCSLQFDPVGKAQVPSPPATSPRARWPTPASPTTTSRPGRLEGAMVKIGDDRQAPSPAPSPAKPPTAKAVKAEVEGRSRAR